MPKSPEPEGSPRLMTTTEIAAEHGVSRQTIHTYRRTGIFPVPVEGEGSTRPRFRQDEVAAFFEANPKQPRKKRRPMPEQPQRGDRKMSYLVTVRVDVDVDAEVTEADIEREVHEACLALPWEFGVVSVVPEEEPHG